MRIKNAIQVGRFIRETRKSLGITQAQLAAVSGTGVRFIVELEKGKPTCQLDKTLYVLRMLGVKVDVSQPI